MKHLSLVIITMLSATLLFANRHNHQINPTPSTLECTQKASYTSTGSYTCNGIPYTVSITATASASAVDCSTATSNATGLAMIYSYDAVQTSIEAMQASCATEM